MELLLATLAIASASLILFVGGVILIVSLTWAISWWVSREEVGKFGVEKAFWPGSSGVSLAASAKEVESRRGPLGVTTFPARRRAA